MDTQSAPTKPVVGSTRARASFLMRAATWAALLVAISLFLSKAVAWGMTGSVAMLGSMIDSGLDILATGFNFFAVRHALQPPDREHRFGHGKAEPIAGLVQATFIGGSAVFLLFHSVERIISPSAIEATAVGVGVTLFALVVTGVLVVFQRYVNRHTGSVAIAADELHYRSDLFLNGAVLVAFALASPAIGLGWTDPFIGIAIALFVGKAAFEISRRSYDQLMDHEFDETEREEIKALVLQHPGVVSMHDLRTRRSGRDAFIQLHLELPPSLTLAAAHAIADAVEIRIAKQFPEAEVIIHQDPAGLEEPHSPLQVEETVRPG